MMCCQTAMAPASIPNQAQSSPGMSDAFESYTNTIPRASVGGSPEHLDRGQTYVENIEERNSPMRHALMSNQSSVSSCLGCELTFSMALSSSDDSHDSRDPVDVVRL